jgi:hypothetical protein
MQNSLMIVTFLFQSLYGMTIDNAKRQSGIVTFVSKHLNEDTQSRRHSLDFLEEQTSMTVQTTSIVAAIAVIYARIKNMRIAQNQNSNIDNCTRC